MLAFDTETALIAPAKLAPELACITYSDGERDNIVHWSEGLSTAKWLLEQELTTANGSYDLLVLWAAYPELRDAIFEGLAAGRYHDVLIRQKLMDIGAGKYRRVYKRFPGQEKATYLGYKLSDLHARYFGTFMEKDEWRLRYGELRPLPLSQWPAGAIQYASYDAVATARIHDLQTQAAVEPGCKNNLHDAAAQMRAAFALSLASCRGVCADQRQVEKVIGLIDREQPGLAKTLLQASLARYDKREDRYIRNEKNAKALMFAAVGDSGELTDTGYKKVKAREMTKEEALRAGYIKIDEEWCENSGNPSLVAYFHFRQNQLLRAKLSHIHIAARAGLPVQTSFEVLMETGRTSSSENKLIPNSMALQNPPRKGGMRECFVARPGWSFIACDYGQAELVSLAQVTFAAFGHSKMRELINAKQDLHVDFGKEILNLQQHSKLTYDDAWKLHKAKDPQMKEMRTLAKCFHPDTEVLTKAGWVRLCELKVGVAVAAASFSDGGKTTIRWEVPTHLTTRKAAELVHLKNKNIDLLVTPDHRMAAWTPKEKTPLAPARDPKTGRMLAQGGRQRASQLVHEICMPEELVKKRAWPSVGLCAEGAREIPEQWLRLAVAVQADGNYARYKDGRRTGAIRLGFTKKRKIERMRGLLQGLDYREVLVGKKGVVTFYLSAAVADRIFVLLDEDKTLPWSWLDLTQPCREAVLDEAQHWDSHIYEMGRGSFKYSSSIKKNVDVLHAIASITNRKACVSVQQSRVPNYGLSVKDRANTRGGALTARRVVWGKDVFCLTVPSDAVLVRHAGKTVVTHQCFNFGKPGGLGAGSFQSYARKAWGVEISFEESRRLGRQWLHHFPEMKLYFEWISGLVEAGDGVTDIQQFMSGRWRGKCFYTQAANTMFQGLTADAAKAAFWEVTRHCYTIKSSPLYGCRPVLFVHDEIITEAPEDQAAEAAVEMERVMIEVYSRYTPDVRITADAHLMKRWSKDAEAVFDERGKLVLWEPAGIEDERVE